jgi:microsomal epoxide hydrolase
MMRESWLQCYSFNVHLTRPETLSVAMMDSPVGTASWIVEKYYYWTDQRQRPFEKILTKFSR